MDFNSQLIILGTSSQGQTSWYRELFSGYRIAYQIGVDSEGNAYHGGNSYDSNTADYKATITKLNNNGDILWCKEESSNENVFCYTVGVGSTSVWISGEGDTLGAGGGAGFHSQLDLDGNVIRHQKSYRDPSYATVVPLRDVSVDSSGNAYFASGSGLYSYDLSTEVVTKINVNGTVAWSNYYDGGSQPTTPYIASSIECITVSPSDSIYAVGHKSEWYPGQQLTYYDGLVMKLNSSGTLQWHKKSTLRNCYARACVADYEDNLIVCHLIPAVGNRLEKFNSSGTLLWSKTLGLYNVPGQTFKMSVDSSNNIYIPGGNVIKFDPSGNIVWQFACSPGTSSIVHDGDRGLYASTNNGVFYFPDDGNVNYGSYGPVTISSSSITTENSTNTYSDYTGSASGSEGYSSSAYSSTYTSTTPTGGITRF